MNRYRYHFLCVASLVVWLPAMAHGQVTPTMATELRRIGQVVDPTCTARLYRGLHPTTPPAGVTISRDVSFGPDARDVIDIFSAERGDAASTVLIYVPGGQGNKTSRETPVFYDNIGLWATANGMVGINMQRHPGQAWDDPAKDVARLIQWVRAHAATYRGDSERVFIWAQSAGNGPVGTYLGRPELHGPMGVGVKGAILMSGQWNIAPLAVPRVTLPEQPAPGSTCGAAPAAPLAAAPPADAATQAARSTLPQYLKMQLPLLFATAELDPGVSGGMSPFYQTLHDAMCTGRGARCPTLLYMKGQSHMSEVYGINTADTSVSAPILAWIRSVK